MDTRDERSSAAGSPAGDAVVYIVDDDAELREYLRWVLEPSGWRVLAYDNAQAFLDAHDPDVVGCVVTDLRMPGLSGLDLQATLAERGIKRPLIMMSAFAEVSSAVRAMRDGAVDFLEKPFDAQILLERVRGALDADREARQLAAERAEVAASLARLTPRQRSVLEGLTAGKPSKIIAAELGVSPRTVDVHRFRLMHQLGAQSLPDLFRRVLLVRGGD
jgi:FixJ family two-component response regulator